MDETEEAVETEGTVTDPVCGMSTDLTESYLSHAYDGDTYHFCSGRCLEKFKVDPDRCIHSDDGSHGNHAEDSKSDPGKGVIYTCPMHPEIRPESDTRQRHLGSMETMHR